VENGTETTSLSWRGQAAMEKDAAEGESSVPPDLCSVPILCVSIALDVCTSLSWNLSSCDEMVCSWVDRLIPTQPLSCSCLFLCWQNLAQNPAHTAQNRLSLSTYSTEHPLAGWGPKTSGTACKLCHQLSFPLNPCCCRKKFSTF
jgi:hypothetical protein